MNQRTEVKRRKKSFWAMLLSLMLIINSISVPVRADNYTIPSTNIYSLDGQCIKPGDTITWTKNVSIIYEIDDSNNTVSDDNADHWTTDSNGMKVYTVLSPASVRASETGFKYWKVTYIDGSADEIYSIKLSIPTFYTVTFKNEDGTVLYSDIFEAGAKPTYNGPTPTKQGTAQYTYTFSGWSPTVDAITGDTVYTAQYSRTENKYTVTWKNDDGTVLETDNDVPYGTKPTYDGTTPTKQADAQYTYTFSGWSPAVNAITGNTEYTAQYSGTVKKYTVTWKNDDGTTLETDNEVPYGTKPTYDSATPTKQATAQYTYTFSGWSPTVNAITGDTEYTAQYSRTENKYTVTWKNDDGTTLETDNEVTYGTTPTYDGATPTKQATAQYTYTFSGWNPTVDAITGDTVYTAQYSQTENKYTVTWKNDNGTVLETDENVTYGTTPTYDGATPTKQRTAQYTYTFSGWDPTVDAVTGDTVYTAQYSSTVNKYKITWKSIGQIIETDTDVEYGTTPTYDGTTPTKGTDKQYSYTFDGWNPEVKTVTDDATYEAKFKSTVNKYTVTWKNDDGTTLETDNEVPYGTIPTYDSATPTKQGTAQYTYTFSGWSPTVDAITGDTEYTAQYTPTVNKYTVTWKNDGGKVLETDTDVPYGTMPTYDGATPTKKATAQYTYSFSGWSPTVEAITGNTVYTAQYTPTVNKYTVTWKNDDGTVLETDTDVPYGTTPTYDGATPTKKATAQYTYSFSGWSPTVDAITGNTVYTAQYTPTVNKYTVTWKNDGGKVLETDTDVPYGTTPKYDGETPTKKATAQYTYSFSGWSPTVDAITGNTVYTAQYTPTVNKYTVTWKNDDGTTLETDNEVPYGTIPTYDSATPTKQGTAQYTYTFSGWSPTVDAITGDTEYTAQYTPKVNKYTVTWKNDGGKVLETDTDVQYGTTPTYDGATPTKKATSQYTYSFSGWSPTVDAITGNTVYTAQYTPTVNKYTVTWKNDNGTVLETDENVTYGTTPTYDGATPTKKATAQYTYSFSGWSPTVEAITGNTVYTAQYSDTVNKYTVTWKNIGQTIETDTNVEYGEMPTYDGATPTKKADKQYSYTFDGWNPEVETVTGDASYEAKYKPAVNKYKVTFVDEDGTTVLKTAESYEYGTKAADIVRPKEPTKTATAEWTYTFDGWTPAITDVTDNATYKATYTATRNKYNVTFVDEDGTTVLKDAAEYEYGTKAAEIVKPENPKKKATAEYTYTFAGWSPEITDVTGTATYKATYTATKNKYKVTFVDEDGTTVLKDAAEYDYGTAAADIEKPEDPTKKATAEYTYIFGGWNPKVEKVTGDVTYKAVYTATKNKYDIDFVDEDGTTVLKAATAYEYGTKAADIIKPENPNKQPTEAYTYTFTGWTPEIQNVTEKATYKAVYSETDRMYKVTFVDDDGTSVLKESEYKYGTKASDVVKPEDPTKPATAEYTYTFTGWDKEITDVTKDVVYKATYTAVKNKYSVTFVDEDGTTVLKDAEEYEYGTKAADIEKPVDPIKEANAEYTYTFAGWSPELKDVTGNVTYKAVYSAKKNQYKITFVDEDGTTILKDATPYDYGTSAEDIVKPVAEKASTEEYVYEFAGWTPEVTEVTGDKTYTAVYTEKDRLYKVTFVDDDGTSVIKVKDSEGNEVDSISYKYGTKSSEVATPDTPEKASTAEFSYSFAGWEPAVTDVIEDAVYKAVYINTLRQYYVTFVDDDGVTVLKEKTLYDYGTEASEIVKPEDPVKAEDEDYIYSFAGWEPSIEEVTGDVIYKAVYNKTSKKPVTYNIRYDLNGGTLDGKTGVISIQAEEGTVITIPDAPTKDGYKFLYWKGSEYHPGDKYTVVGDHTFTAEWQMIVKDEPKKEEPKKDKDTPGTGDAADPLLWMAISICALSGIIFIRKKKRQ